VTLAVTVRGIAAAEEVWYVFDNTASGAAIENAWELRERLIEAVTSFVRRASGDRSKTTARSIDEEVPMPFKSQAQRRKFAQLLVEGKISNETFEEWNRETGRKKLPERVGSKANSSKTKSQRRRTTKKRTARKP
jgi:hypothetical protein